MIFLNQLQMKIIRSLVHYKLNLNDIHICILFITSTKSTILSVDIISTTVTTIKITTNIVCLIITKSITNPVSVTTLTAYQEEYKKQILHKERQKINIIRQPYILGLSPQVHKFGPPKEPSHPFPTHNNLQHQPSAPHQSHFPSW